MQEFIKKDLLNVNLRSKTQVIEEQNKKGSSDFVEMISKLNTSSIQVHIFHWQTKKKGSLSQHKAFGGYYGKIPELIDGLVESYQGKYDIITNFTCDGVEQYKGKEESIQYFEDLVSMVEKKRKSIKESWIQNQIDNVCQLIYGTLYKLKNLE
jgi:DNA-binding ferritin-like protein